MTHMSTSLAVGVEGFVTNSTHLNLGCQGAGGGGGERDRKVLGVKVVDEVEAVVLSGSTPIDVTLESGGGFGFGD